MKDLIKDHVDDWRMYGLVPYNISPIQQGIQFGHALQEYNNLMMDSDTITKEHKEAFDSWRLSGKTFIVLNGGTTNKRIIDDVPFGSLNQHLNTLKELDVFTAEFYEPDLGEQLSAVLFLVPKQVYNKKEFPHFKDYVNERFEDNTDMADFVNRAHKSGEIHQYPEAEEVYIDWLDMIGGSKIETIRNYLSNFERA